MKTIPSILALATLSLAACGGISDEDIRSALNNAEPAQESTLRFAAGETWTGTRVEKEVDGIPYKFEDGKSTPCAQGAANNSATLCGTPSSGVTTKTSVVNATVLGKSDTAITRLPGWAVQENNTVTFDSETFFAVPATSTNGNDLLESNETQVYTLAENNNFVVRIDEDQGSLDATVGQTLYPSHPVRGRTYTDDQGVSWTVTSAASVALASGNAAAAAISGTTIPESLTDLSNLSTFKTTCFYKQAQGGGNYSVEIQNECQNTLTAKFEINVEVGYDLALRQRIYTETFRVTDYGIRDVSGNLSQNLANTETGDFVFLYEVSSTEETFTMTNIVFP